MTPQLQDPKYEPREDGRLWHVAGGYPLPEDEPLMVLRGKDQMVPAAIQAYIDECWTLAEDAEDPEVRRIAREHAATAQERLDTIRAWQAANPDRTGVGCHTCKA